MCAIAGAFNVPHASYVVQLMLKAMQHRGQEAAGIVSCNKDEFCEIRQKGLVDEVFGEVDCDSRLPGTSAVGHVRYSTAGDDGSSAGIQPLWARLRGRSVAVVHNGNRTDYRERRAELELQGAIFQSRSDSELFLHDLARARVTDFDAAVLASLQTAIGAWSILLLTAESLYAAVDPLGFRPLVMAEYGGGTVFASESCAFDLLGINQSEPVERGTVVKMTSGHGYQVKSLPAPNFSRHCSFEHVYFSRPDSNAFGDPSNDIRERLGTCLAAHEQTPFDVVTSVPDSSNAIALAFAEAVGARFRHALIRNHYTGRTFITPRQTARELGVRMKLNAVRSLIEGKRVAVVDDSLVRGTTARKVAQLLRDAGAKEVHMRIGSPPVVHPCHWGIDTPNRQELLAAKTDPSMLASALGLDSLAYLNIDDLRKALQDEDATRYCTTCFTGDPPERQLIPPKSLIRNPP